MRRTYALQIIYRDVVIDSAFLLRNTGEPRQKRTETFSTDFSATLFRQPIGATPLSGC